jgi:hypothetical protein
MQPAHSTYPIDCERSADNGPAAKEGKCDIGRAFDSRFVPADGGANSDEFATPSG